MEIQLNEANQIINDMIKKGKVVKAIEWNDNAVLVRIEFATPVETSHPQEALQNYPSAPIYNGPSYSRHF